MDLSGLKAEVEAAKTPEELRSIMRRVFKSVIEETIHETVGRDGIPSGILYAGVMTYIDIHTYNAIILELIKEKKIRQDGFCMLYWIGR